MSLPAAHTEHSPAIFKNLHRNNGTRNFASTSSSTSLPAERNRRLDIQIDLTPEEQELFFMLRRATEETKLSTTLRVAGGWVRDKLLATPEFSRPGDSPRRAMSNHPPTIGECQTASETTKCEHRPSGDIDIALDDMLGREFAERLNEYLENAGEETHTVGVVLKNPEKSKHLETATMKVGKLWIDFVNLRAEEYSHDSRIPDLMRIGSPSEDAFRRDLTINALFYNINTGEVEDWTRCGVDDLRKGVVATPLAPLTTLLDDPLRALRSVRFAARFGFTMDSALVEAAKDSRVRKALEYKVSRERIGAEVDLMLRSADPVGAISQLFSLGLARTVFSIETCFEDTSKSDFSLLETGLHLLTEAHDHLAEYTVVEPMWDNSQASLTAHGTNEARLHDDAEMRRLLWYAALLKPLHDHFHLGKQHASATRHGRKANNSILKGILFDKLKRPAKDLELVETMIEGANEFTYLLQESYDVTASHVLRNDIRVEDDPVASNGTKFKCSIQGRRIDSALEDDPRWEHAMNFRLPCAKLVKRIGSLWRASLILSLSQRVLQTQGNSDPDEVRQSEIERYRSMVLAMQHLGVIGSWSAKPLLNGREIKAVLPRIPVGPAFGKVIQEQETWTMLHPGADTKDLAQHLVRTFPEYISKPS